MVILTPLGSGIIFLPTRDIVYTPGVHTSVNAARRSACATLLTIDYQSWHRTSPPTRSLRAELPVMTPRAVVKILMPRPPSTLGTSWLPTYTRHPGRETRSILEITGRLPGVYFR